MTATRYSRSVLRVQPCWQRHGEGFDGYQDWASSTMLQTLADLLLPNRPNRSGVAVSENVVVDRPPR